MNIFLIHGEIMISLTSQAQCALSVLHAAGFEAYLIGGCVRDYIMGKEPNDFDITTNALPNEIINCFSDNYKCVLTGIAHGTVTVIISGAALEITTFRRDGDYSNHRRPKEVFFSSSLREDASRRDFTINAIAYCRDTGFIDYYGGISDIKNKKIRCIGDADKRFNEDALRILRALRFSSVLGFEIDQNTRRALFKNKHLLSFVSKERIFSELKKTLCGKNIKNVLMEYIDIFAEIMPEISLMKGFEQKNPHHIFDVLRHTAEAVNNIEHTDTLRLAALFHDIGKPYCFSLDDNNIGHFYGHNKKSAKLCEKILLDLKADSKTLNEVKTLVLHHDAPIPPTEKAVKRKLNSLGEELFEGLIKLQRADNLALSPLYHYRQEDYNNLEKIARKIIEKKECFSLKDLAVNGDDLISLGYTGKEIGENLRFLLSAVIDGRAENDKEKLISMLKREKSSE